MGKELGVIVGEVGSGWGEWVTGTEGGTGRDEHWVLFCMLANRTLIKSKFIIKKKKETKCGTWVAQSVKLLS